MPTSSSGGPRGLLGIPVAFLLQLRGDGGGRVSELRSLPDLIWCCVDLIFSLHGYPIDNLSWKGVDAKSFAGNATASTSLLP